LWSSLHCYESTTAANFTSKASGSTQQWQKLQEEANRAGPEMICAVSQQEWYSNLLTPNQNMPSILKLLSLSISMVFEFLMW